MLLVVSAPFKSVRTVIFCWPLACSDHSWPLKEPGRTMRGRLCRIGVGRSVAFGGGGTTGGRSMGIARLHSKGLWAVLL